MKIIEYKNLNNRFTNSQIRDFIDACMFEFLNREFEDLQDVISSYSHGMKQKLVIISALIHEPKLLVLDEPFVGLDPKSSFILKEYMKDLTKNGCSIFFSSHVLEVVEKLCDKVGIIKNGKLITSGTVEEVKGNESLEEVFLELINDEQ